MKKRVFAMFIAIIMCVAVLAGCNKNGKKNDPNATEKPEPDAPASTEYVAIIGGEKIYASEFKYFLYDALREIDYSVIDIPDDATEKEQYELMLNFLNEEDENGVSNLDKAVDRAFELCTMFKVTYLQGVKGGFDLSDDEKKEQYDSIDEFIDQYLSMYGKEYNATSRDDMMKVMYSMNVNDYKRLAVQQVISNNFAKDVIEKLKPTESEIEQFYNDNEDTYRIVKVRHILIKTLDEDDKPLNEEEKQKKYERALKVKEKVEQADEDEIEAIVKGYSEDTDLSNLGIYEVSKNSGFVKEFEEWALKQEEVTDVVEIIETSYGYHVMMCEGIKTLEDEKVKEKVTEGLKNDLFDKQTKEKLQLEEYKVTEKNDDLIKKATEEFITVLFESDEEETTPTPAPTATPAATEEN